MTQRKLKGLEIVDPISLRCRNVRTMHARSAPDLDAERLAELTLAQHAAPLQRERAFARLEGDAVKRAPTTLYSPYANYRLAQANSDSGDRRECLSHTKPARPEVCSKLEVEV